MKSASLGRILHFGNGPAHGTLRASSVRSATSIAGLYRRDQAPLGEACRSAPLPEPALPLLTELTNKFVGAHCYKSPRPFRDTTLHGNDGFVDLQALTGLFSGEHGAPNGANESIQGREMPRPSLRRSVFGCRRSDFGLRISFGIRISDFGFLPPLFLSLALFASGLRLVAASPDAFFQAGTTAYRASDYAHAAEAFRLSVALQPASGALQDLGNAEWRCQHTGAAILAWEQARWLDPFNRSVRQNLGFARKTAQLEAPDLTWYEVVSTWLPASWWAWIAGTSLWLAVGMGILPGVLRQRKATWHQAVAALGLMVFLLSLPAHIGVQTRSRIGFVLKQDTPLRLTPTLEAQAITHLGSGEPGRWVRARGDYVLIRTSRALGWVEGDQFGLACPRTSEKAR